MEDQIGKCIICNNDSVYIDSKTNEELCNQCAKVNEGIYESRGERGKYKKSR